MGAGQRGAARRGAGEGRARDRPEQVAGHSQGRARTPARPHARRQHPAALAARRGAARPSDPASERASERESSPRATPTTTHACADPPGAPNTLRPAGAAAQCGAQRKVTARAARRRGHSPVVAGRAASGDGAKDAVDNGLVLPEFLPTSSVEDRDAGGYRVTEDKNSFAFDLGSAEGPDAEAVSAPRRLESLLHGNVRTDGTCILT